MAIQRPVPSPAQIRSYLTAHGWHKGWDLPESGEMFVFEELDDGGEEITVFVPKHAEYEDYPHGVSSAVDTLAAIERRPKEAVWDDLSATAVPAATPTPSPSAPPADVPAPADPVTP